MSAVKSTNRAISLLVQELSTKFLEIIRNGRSTPGAIQPNFNEDNSWSQVIKSIDILSKVGVKVR